MKAGYVKHHIKNRTNKGRSQPENLLYIREDKEKLLHNIFGNRDFYDMILLILRTARAKQYEGVNPRIRKLYKFID